MENKLQSILKQEISVLKNQALSDSDIADLLVSLMLWKFLSEEFKNPKLRANIPEKRYFFNYVSESLSAHLGNDILRAFKQWENANSKLLKNLLDTKRSIVDALGHNMLKNICTNVCVIYDLSIKNRFADFFSIIENEFANSSKQAHLLITPEEIVKLLTSLINPNINKATLYDPYCRTGQILSTSIEQIGSIAKVSANTNNHIGWKLSMSKSIMLYFPECIIEQCDIYDNPFNDKFDYIISNPPFGGRPGKELNFENAEWSKKFGGIRNELNYVCYILDHLSEVGQASVVVPVGLLFGTGKIQAFRKHLIEANVIEAIISLPSRVFYQTGVMTAILVLNKNKKNNKVLLFDATELGVRQRDRHQLSNENIASIVKMVKSFRTQKKTEVSELKANAIEIDFKMFEQNNFDFQFSSYRTNETVSTLQLRPPTEILNEIVSLQEELKNCQNEINTLNTNYYTHKK